VCPGKLGTKVGRHAESCLLTGLPGRGPEPNHLRTRHWMASVPELKVLSLEDVLQIHGILVEDFAGTTDPIYPPGVRSMNLLASAVSRQETGLGDRIKYPDPVSNAATLAFGLCMDHPFHNGNKRTALVSLLVHLDRNRLTLYSTRQKDLFDLIISVADHTIGLRHASSREDRGRRRRHRDSDEEVQALATWILQRSAKVRRGERLITYRELRRILEGFGYSLQYPKGNRIDVVKTETIHTGFFKKRQKVEIKHIGSIGYPGEHHEVPLKVLKHIRRLCLLTEEDGCDTDSFYEQAAVIDGFVNRYRTILRRLARR